MYTEERADRLREIRPSRYRDKQKEKKRAHYIVKLYTRNTCRCLSNTNRTRLSAGLHADNALSASTCNAVYILIITWISARRLADFAFKPSNLILAPRINPNALHVGFHTFVESCMRLSRRPVIFQRQSTVRQNA